MVRFAVPAKKSGTVGTVPTVPGATAVNIGIKRRTVYRSEQEPTWQVPLWTLVQDPHTDAPTKAAFKKEAAGKKKIIIILNT